MQGRARLRISLALWAVFLTHSTTGSAHADRADTRKAQPEDAGHQEDPLLNPDIKISFEGE